MRHILLSALMILLLGGCAHSPPPEIGRAAAAHVLIFSHTTGYRRESIEPGVAAIRSIAERQGLAVTASEDPAVFSAAGLTGVAAIVLLSNTTDPKRPESEWLTGERRQALQDFVHRGGGVLAVHAAADSHYGWPWYGRMIGGRFERHPSGTPRGHVSILDPDHPSTRALPRQAGRIDEWYYFQDYDPTSRLLVMLDPASIGEKDVNPNPVSWARSFEGGRVFYTAMGHTSQSYSEPFFLEHLAGGLRWVLGRD
jgi:hypothetical protein